MDFLRDVGPDALINAFTVNLKTNTSIALVNELQTIAFNELNGKCSMSVTVLYLSPLYCKIFTQNSGYRLSRCFGSMVVRLSACPSGNNR